MNRLPPELSGHAALAHPETGEVLPLDQLPPGRLAQALEELDERQRQLKELRGQVTGELQRRLKQAERRSITWDGYQVELEQPRESVWDAEELEAAMRDLVDQGTLRASELTGVIKRDPVVSRSAAGDLARRLNGSARQAIEACRSWKDKGHPRIRVERLPQAIQPPADQPAINSERGN